MIVRILGEGQRNVPDSEIDALNQLDDDLQAAVEADDDARFRAALVALLDRVRAVGTPLPDDALEPSDLVLPADDAHVDEVRELLGDEGLIPG
ncbi:MAG TPA: hypothetical protein VKP64_14520 [Mycobacteriales bacterium]|nr:hypothetical protein [Mycobacteriales bacterium]